jgi:2-keto-4-pentenoate hydratase/2-oxohepta-3-ene-1,7-dioic acid hydratase in catechol pathway
MSAAQTPMVVAAIGRVGRDIDPAQAEPHHIRAYAAGPDLTRRDQQQQAWRELRPCHNRHLTGLRHTFARPSAPPSTPTTSGDAL